MKKIFQSEIDLLKEKRARGELIDSTSLLKNIRERKFTVKDLGINYRWINHWHSKDLLIGKYEDNKWRKFNLAEYVWLKVIIKIRKFNISLETVKAVKEVIDIDFTGKDLLEIQNLNLLEIITQFAPLGKEKNANELLKNQEIINAIEHMSQNYLEIIILDILSLGNWYSILIDSIGKVIVLKYSYMELYSKFQQFKDIMTGSYISISITEILKEFILVIELNRLNNKRISLLSDEEYEVLETVRKEDLKSVTIKYGQNKKINVIEEIKEEKVDKAARLMDILMKHGYQDITVKTQNGKIVYCENKRKTIFNTKD